MQEITYTNSNGDSIKIGSKPPFVLSKIEGLGDVEADIQMQKSPYQDGLTHIDTLLKPRYLSMKVSILAIDRIDVSTKRELLAKVFNPKLSGVIKYENGRVIRQINAYPEHVPKYASNDRGKDYQIASVNLVCPNPYWLSLSMTEEPAFEPLFQFPFEGPFQMGIQRDQRIIVNDGDAPAPIQVEFFGPALNPKIINNTTGEFIKINQQLEENERMMIDTTDSTVYFINAAGIIRDVFPWTDLSSTFFKLAIGENDIEYTADSDIQGTIVNISYSTLYTAV